MTTLMTKVSRSSGRFRLLVAGSLLLGAAACGKILDVNNPNNVEESALANPQAATAEASGVLAGSATTSTNSSMGPSPASGKHATWPMKRLLGWRDSTRPAH